MATYGKIIECDIERSTLDTDDIILKLKKSGEPIDVTGWTANLTVNLTKDGEGQVNAFEADGVVFGTPANGQIAIDMTLFNMAKGKYYHDIRVIDASGKGRESLAGKFTVTQRIAKA